MTERARPATPERGAGGTPMTEQEHAYLDRKIVRGSAWVGLSHGGSKVLAMVSTLALVRLVEPKAFGLMALAWAALQVVQAVQESGVGTALVFRRTDVRRAAGTALVVSVASGTALYATGFAVAPLVARLFHTPELTNVLRVFALMIVLRALTIVPGAILERELNFRGRAKAELGGALVQPCVAIVLAASGFGVWSLVAGALASSATEAAIAWLVVPWRPSPRQADRRILKELVRYGRYVSAANLVVLANTTIDNLIVGRVLGATQLGFYTVTFRVATMPNMLGLIVGRVMFPVYSRLQEERAAFRRAYVQNLQRVALFSLPASVGLAVAAEPIVLGLLGERWRPVVTPLRILAIFALARSFTSPSGEVFKGVGKPHLVAAFGLPHLVLSVPALVLLVPRHGLDGAALAMVVPMAIIGAGMFAMSMRLLELTYADLARALLPSIGCTAIMAAVIAALLPLVAGLPPLLALVVVVAAAVVAYAGSTAVLARSVIVPIWLGLRGA